MNLSSADFETRLAAIRARLADPVLTVPEGQKKSEDVAFLLEALDGLLQERETLRGKNNVLAKQMLELSAEIENIKSDFGGNNLR